MKPDSRSPQPTSRPRVTEEEGYRSALKNIVHKASGESRHDLTPQTTAALEARVLEIAKVAPVVIARACRKLRDTAQTIERDAGNRQDATPEQSAAKAERLRARAERIEKLVAGK